MSDCTVDGPPRIRNTIVHSVGIGCCLGLPAPACTSGPGPGAMDTGKEHGEEGSTIDAKLMPERYAGKPLA